jgi:hypothetical protein
MKAAIIKFATDFAEGAAAGAIAAFVAIPADQLASAKTIAYIVVLGAFDGAISAARRYIVAKA